MVDGETQAYELVSIGGAASPLADNIRQDISECAASHAVKLGQARETASHVAADRIVANALKVSDGTSVLRLERVVTISDGTPIEWRLAFLLVPAK